MVAYQALIEGVNDVTLGYLFTGVTELEEIKKETVETPEEGLPYIRIHTKFNNFKLINEVLRNCNKKLNKNGYVTGFVETLEKRTRRLKKDKNIIHAKLIFLFDFIFCRILPKISPFKTIYKRFHLVKNRAISRCEMLGRLVFCGFEVVKYWENDNFLHFIAQKVRDPNPGKHNYGLFYSARRMGKNGKIIKMYKIRTMHPYAEYLQKYIVDNNKLDRNGKIKDDFRVTPWAHSLRKYFLDEVPQLFSLLKGDIRLVGVRPLSLHFYSLYPEDLKMERTKYRPGLIPPYYADMPQSFEEIIESERKYLEMFRKQPFLTDLIYFFKAMKNILLKHAHSA